MLISKLFTPLVALLLLAGSSQAQTRGEAPVPANDSQYQEVRVVVTLPKAVSVVRDYGKILLSRNDEENKLNKLTKRLRNKTERPEVEVTLELPRNWVTKKLGLAE